MLFKKFLNIGARQRLPLRIKTAQTLNLAEQQIPYTLISSNLARRLTLKISAKNGLEVVVPRRYHPGQLHHFIQQKEQWILKNLHKISRQKRDTFQLVDGASISILGETKTIRIIPTSKKTSSVKEVKTLKYIGDTAYYDGTELHVFSIGQKQETLKAFEKYLRQIAQKHFLKRTPEISKIMGTHFNNITIRAQKSRWGSCSASNNLNFNWHLILMPLAVSDYVIIHELAHTIQHNHSPKFYAIVQKFCPDYKNLRKTLKNRL